MAKIHLEDLETFGVDLNEKDKNQTVHCWSGTHDDTSPSMTVHLGKMVFNCMSCGFKGKILEHPEETAKEENVFDSLPEVPTDLSQGVLDAVYLGRGVDWTDLYKCGADIFTQGDSVAGFSVGDFSHTYDLATGQYKSYGKKPILQYQGSSKTYIAVEGLFDFLSLVKYGYSAICLFGCNVSPDTLFNLRFVPVAYIMDNDHAGWKASKVIAKLLKEFGSKNICTVLPIPGVKDLDDLRKSSAREFTNYVDGVLDRFRDDEDSVDYLLRQRRSKDIYYLPTQIPVVDKDLKGGYCPGLHFIGAPPGVGKTAYVVHMARVTAKAGHKVLYASYEISKRQLFARLLCSELDTPYPWDSIERDMSKITEEDITANDALIRNTNIVMFKSVGQLEYLIKKHSPRLVVIDYLQQMVSSGEDEMDGINRNLSELNRIQSENDCVILVVSSLNRTGYAEISMSAFKNSGNVEYCASTAVIMTSDGARQSLHKVKDRRGNGASSVSFTGNLGLCKFGG